MRWEDERYVRVYTRDTVDWLALSFEAQGLFTLLLRKVDRAGVLALGKRGKQAVAVAVGHASRWETLAPALDELLADGCVILDGDRLVVPNFLEAQEAKQSDKARQARSRELARTVTKRDIQSQNVTESHTASHAVTGGHTLSQAVTPSRAVPSRAVPCRAEPTTLPAASAPASEEAPFRLSHPEPRRRRPSFAEGLYRRMEQAREEVCSKAGVPFTAEGWRPARQNSALGFLAREQDEGRNGFNDGWDAYLSEPENARRDPPWSIGYFMATRSTWESRAKRGAA